MTTKAQIEQFLAARPVAIAGVSENPKKFGRMAFDELTRKGLPIIPINPNLDQINGTACYRSIDSLPDHVQSLIIVTRKEQTAGLVEAAIRKGIRNIWIQQSSESAEALDLLSGTDVNVISKQCVLMYLQPHGIHKFHRNVKRFFGSLPK